MRIFFTVKVVCCSFLNLYGRYVIRYETSLTIFSLQTQQIEVRLVAIKSAFLSQQPYTPFHFSRTLPLSLNQLVSINLVMNVQFENEKKCKKNTLSSLTTEYSFKTQNCSKCQHGDIQRPYHFPHTHYVKIKLHIRLFF